MATDVLPALALLEREMEELERNANTLRSTINMLRQKHGLPPLEQNTSGSKMSSGTANVSQIKPDTFYGKRLQTAVREYLEMRKSAGLGPAKPREIYDAVTAGGYQFEASSADVALVGLRAMLRKRSQFFHKLPNGTYGLTAWYPHAKQTRATASSEPTRAHDDDEADDADDEGASSEDLVG